MTRPRACDRRGWFAGMGEIDHKDAKITKILAWHVPELAIGVAGLRGWGRLTTKTQRSQRCLRGMSRACIGRGWFAGKGEIDHKDAKITKLLAWHVQELAMGVGLCRATWQFKCWSQSIAHHATDGKGTTTAAQVVDASIHLAQQSHAKQLQGHHG